jgi:hypothetical protein
VCAGEIALALPGGDLALEFVAVVDAPVQALAFEHPDLETFRLLHDRSPKDLPAEEPTRFYLVLNERTAAALNLKFADTIRVQATR